MTPATMQARTVTRLLRENQRLRAELTELRKASRKQIRDAEHAAHLSAAAAIAAAQAELRHLRDELTAHHLEGHQR